MNKMRSLAAGVFAAAAFVAAPLHGQAAPCAPPPPVTHMALEHRQELGISAAQVRRLEVIDARIKKAAPAAGEHAGHGQAATEHSGHAGAEHSGHGAMSESAAYNGSTPAQITRANTDARAVLTARQRTALDSLHARHHGTASCAAPAPAHSHN